MKEKAGDSFIPLPSPLDPTQSHVATKRQTLIPACVGQARACLSKSFKPIQ